MKFSCPLCGGRIEGEEAWIGLQATCPHCARKITIPIIGFRVAAVPNKNAESKEQIEEWDRSASDNKARRAQPPDAEQIYQVNCPDCNGKGVKRDGLFESSNPYEVDQRGTPLVADAVAKDGFQYAELSRLAAIH